MSAAFDTFRQAQAVLEQQVAVTGKALRAIPGVGSGPFGLTPDAISQSPDYRAAKAAYDAAFAALRAFNGKYVKVFKAEIAAERSARRNNQVTTP